MTKEGYVLRRVGIAALAVVLIGAWIHGIYWAGGITQPGNAWTGPGCNAHNLCVPWQAMLIDFAPLILPVLGLCLFMVYETGREICGDMLGDARRQLRSLPSRAELRQREAARKVAEREATIARLEYELGFREPNSAERYYALRAGQLCRCSERSQIARGTFTQMGLPGEYCMSCGRRAD